MINHKLHVNHQLWHCDTSNGEKTFSILNLIMWSVKMRTLKSRDKDFSLYFSEVKRRLFVPERKTLKSIQSVIVNIKWAPLIGWHKVRNKKALFKFRNILSRKLFGQEALQSRVRLLVRDVGEGLRVRRVLWRIGYCQIDKDKVETSLYDSKVVKLNSSPVLTVNFSPPITNHTMMMFQTFLESSECPTWIVSNGNYQVSCG